MLPPYNNLVAHWRMNDNDSNTTVLDSVRGRNGIWQHGNTSTDSVTGKLNRALSFDGTNDYFTVTNTANFNLSTFSISVWLKHANTSVLWDRVLSKKNLYTDSDGYEITLDGTNTGVLYVSGSSNSFCTSNLGINWLLSEWHHICVVYKGTTVFIYLNGVSKTVTGSITPVISNSRALYIGKIESEPTTMWDGVMDDFRYYNMELTQSHVSSLYNNGNGTEYSGDASNSIIMGFNN